MSRSVIVSIPDVVINGVFASMARDDSKMPAPVVVPYAVILYLRQVGCAGCVVRESDYPVKDQLVYLVFHVGANSPKMILNLPTG
jgi:hypothetical protein